MTETSRFNLIGKAIENAQKAITEVGDFSFVIFVEEKVAKGNDFFSATGASRQDKTLLKRASSEILKVSTSLKGI